MFSSSNTVVVNGFSDGIKISVEAANIGGSDLDGRPLLLEKYAARAFKRMSKDMRNIGLEIKVNYAFRTMRQQNRLYRRNKGYANKPGTSTHQEGIAIDVSGCTKRHRTRECRWMRRFASRYGFYQTIDREPWHWEYRPTPRIVSEKKYLPSDSHVSSAMACTE